MKRLGIWLCFVLMAALLPAAFAADVQQEVPTQAQTAGVDASGEGSASDGSLLTEEASLCAVASDSAATAMGGTCQEGRGCASSSQCGGGTCFRHKCFC